MRQPSPETLLALHLAGLLPETPAYRLALDATRVVSLAKAHRTLGEHSCNVELTSRQQTRYDSLRARADAILLPYGMEMNNPWGLCRYAVPLGHDGASETSCIFIA